MKEVDIVIGLGFGDEGKGLVTDYLSAKSNNTLVIRFNGGGQAGHTVIDPNDKKRHVFSNFGAGSFNNAPTYWSKYCTFSPGAFLNELNALQASGMAPKVYIDNLCPVITHYDMLFNRLLEKKRGKNCHGSVGAGFGTTVSRHCYTPYKLHARELSMAEMIKFRLRVIRDYYGKKAMTNGISGFDNFDHDSEDEKFLESCALLFQDSFEGTPIFTNEHKILHEEKWKSFVFEGAQGVLLDMDHGFFPHVTHSHTTSRNALEMIKRNFGNQIPVTINYVSRIYLTRHGAGPLPYEEQVIKLRQNENETNTCNEFQGDFRVAPINFDLLDYALDCDRNYSRGAANNLFLTCTNQVEQKVPFVLSNKIIQGSINNIGGYLKSRFENVLTSNCPTREGISK